MGLDEGFLAQIPDTLTVEVDGKSTPLRETQFIKDAPDIPTLIKNAYEAHKEVGSRLSLRTQDPAGWRKENLPKLYKAGLLDAPPASPDEYEIAPPEHLPENVKWDEERTKKYTQILHKYGIPKTAAHELTNLYLESVEQAARSLKTSYDDGMAALKREYGDKFDSMKEQASRFAKMIFKTDDELAFFEQTGMGNHPTFLSIMMRLAPLAMSDSSALTGLQESGVAAASGVDVRTEVADIMTNKQNPRHEGYWKRDPKVIQYIDELYRKAYGDAKVTLT